MKEKTKDLIYQILATIVALIVMAIPVIFLAILTFGVYEEIEYRKELDEYCKTITYDGVENLGKKAWSKDEYVCYKIIPHSSGVGTTKMYTGEIK